MSGIERYARAMCAIIGLWFLLLSAPSHADVGEAKAQTGAVGSATGSAPSEGAVSPGDVARVWFERLRRQDREGLKALMDIPCSIRGFRMMNGPEACECGGKQVPNFQHCTTGATGAILEINDESGFARALRCLQLNQGLIGSIPESIQGQRPANASPGSDLTAGVLKLVSPTSMSRRLSRYRKELLVRAKTHHLVQAQMKDDNGLTFTVVLTMQKAVPLKIDGVFIDELFQE